MILMIVLKKKFYYKIKINKIYLNKMKNQLIKYKVNMEMIQLNNPKIFMKKQVNKKIMMKFYKN